MGLEKSKVFERNDSPFNVSARGKERVYHFSSKQRIMSKILVKVIPN